ncbi:hypothetical protein SAMN05216228_102785 [Rhizobium tibeticum]|uniref:Uncharacterized protein n=1 Tax=Rhizobium tibeticum TaxID=501024 RepID=A0A1H8T769_9HYPH|nr:hypothetical protein RTCCBAU85039_5023 [Rhizobium tibeticum]SEO86751.1 hypothetical protein SAMN05216228_102785 [Rhizobium tibeticum]
MESGRGFGHLKSQKRRTVKLESEKVSGPASRLYGDDPASHAYVNSKDRNSVSFARHNRK